VLLTANCSTNFHAHFPNSYSWIIRLSTVFRLNRAHHFAKFDAYSSRARPCYALTIEISPVLDIWKLEKARKKCLMTMQCCVCCSFALSTRFQNLSSLCFPVSFHGPVCVPSSHLLPFSHPILLLSPTVRSTGSRASNQLLARDFVIVLQSDTSISDTSISDTSVYFCQFTRRNIPEDSYLLLPIWHFLL
jgi:hypothetical protein